MQLIQAAKSSVSSEIYQQKVSDKNDASDIFGSDVISLLDSSKEFAAEIFVVEAASRRPCRDS